MSDNVRRGAKEPVCITGVWLRREGAEHSGDAVVLVEFGGEWVEIIRERFDGNFSHIAEPLGIRRRRSAGSAPEERTA